MSFSAQKKRWLRVRPLLILAALLCGFGLAAQQTAPPDELPPPVVRVTTRLVLVDVVVTDKKGQPVTDLTREDLTLLENKKPQRIAFFSLEQPAGRVQEEGVEPPPLPPHVYTNRPEYRRPPGPLTILLLDKLNTPLLDQAYARQQMFRYLTTQLRPGQRMAILALTYQRLLLLQDFTTDPQLLVAALKKYQPQKSEPLARVEKKWDLVIDPLIASRLPDLLAGIERFEAVERARSIGTRVRITRGALRAIARAVAGYPGRKNLIWVTAAFPLTILPEEREHPYRSYADEMRRTANLLTDARIAVYPVDARGLVGSLLPGASESGRNPLGVVPRRGEVFEGLGRRSTQIVDPQHTMNTLARQTGGRAFYNRNDIDRAVALAVEDGSTYYTLGYYPENKDWDGKFRRIKVKVARKGLRVRHRRGYYALDPTPPKDEPETRQEKLLAALNVPLPATEVTFWVRVPPPAATEPAQVVVEFVVDPQTLAFEEGEEGRQHFNLDFLVVAVSSEGKAAAVSHQTLEAGLRPETYARVRQQGLPYRTQLELEPGRYQLRLAVRDNRTGLLGTFQVPLVLQKP